MSGWLKAPTRLLNRTLPLRRNIRAPPRTALVTQKNAVVSRYLTTAPTESVAVHDPAHTYETKIGDSANDHAAPRNTLFETRGGWLFRALLPVSCPGCGALAQEVDSTEPGYYRRSRRGVRTYLKSKRRSSLETITSAEEFDEGDVEAALEQATALADGQSFTTSFSETVPIPVCDRCHGLTNNSSGVPIAHPSLEDIADSIAESPFPRNHIYHVLDAADFPMSLEPRILSSLALGRGRTQNRRSRHRYPYKPTFSFIITRSDLLAPTKEQVDRSLPYFQSLLRAGLGRTGEKLRLGNVHLVSAKRGWWTREIKEDIWKRGGGNWMVGKFNVGKSNLFEVLFPKGSGDRAPVYAELLKQQHESPRPEQEALPEMGLLPPAQPETPFPVLPLVSNLPGTTASPIRLPFGNGKGELIDLPGLERGTLADQVRQEHKLDLVMTDRPTATQHNIKAGQSLLLGGGLIRITPNLDPNDQSTAVSAIPFVPLDSHVTATEKAMGNQQQTRDSGIKSILAEDVGQTFQSAGVIALNTDVTKKYAGPVLRAGVPFDRLPFRVYSTDILIEGVGWVELICQVRKRRKKSPTPLQSTPSDPEDIDHSENDNGEAILSWFKPYAPSLDAPSTHASSVFSDKTDNDQYPTVEVFTPHGKSISSRPSLSAWHMWREGSGKHGRNAVTKRPRRSMKGAKKREKLQTRAAAANGAAA
jgi:genetic interactor of prohibitins 3, mitochondrial